MRVIVTLLAIVTLFGCFGCDLTWGTVQGKVCPAAVCPDPTVDESIDELIDAGIDVLLGEDGD